MLFLAEDVGVEERNVDSFLELLYKEKDESLAIPTCISSVKHCWTYNLYKFYFNVEIYSKLSVCV